MIKRKRKWTMTDGVTRNAGQGPRIYRSDMDAFLTFCERNGHKTRKHPDLFTDGWQVQHKGHWMSLLWNKSWARYTADWRLSLIVQSFAAEAAAPEKGQP
jgi:hypothetical protein